MSTSNVVNNGKVAKEYTSVRSPIATRIQSNGTYVTLATRLEQLNLGTSKGTQMFRPDAKGQQWHVDGDHRTKSTHSSAHAINVFIALGDITLDMGPTEFRPCSHFLSRKLFKFMMLARARKQLHAPVQPVASSGDAVIFDYRTLHRGTENNSQLPRAMLELVFFKKGYTDLLNFPKRSIFKNVKKTTPSTIVREK